MALVQSSSLMTLGLKGDRGMVRHNSVPSLRAIPTEFKFGRPEYAVRADMHAIAVYCVQSWKLKINGLDSFHNYGVDLLPLGPSFV